MTIVDPIHTHSTPHLNCVCHWPSLIPKSNPDDRVRVRELRVRVRLFLSETIELHSTVAAP